MTGVWKNGLNFSQKKYEVIDEFYFKPHVRSDLRCSIPRVILEKFNIDKLLNPVAFVCTEDSASGRKSLRIKKLYKETNSFTISFKAEKNFSKPTVKVLDIKPEKELLKRATSENLITNYLPEHTAGSTPLYSFNYGSKLLVGGYGKKEMIIEKTVEFDNSTLSALGLYFAEGGKTSASFTNSWPDAINQTLGFVERYFNTDRKNVKATIYCHPSLKRKQSKLEEFWGSQTGISNFASKLHFGKNSTSPQGTLELYFCSEVMKEIFLSLLSKLNFFKINKTPLIQGVLSGDGSPIQQTKYSVTHHIPFDKKDLANECFIKNTFSEFKTGKAGVSKLTVYPSWDQNKGLLLSDAYKFNPLNRARFAKRFLELPESIRKKDDRIVVNYRLKEYPNVLRALKNHYNCLTDLELISEEKAGEKLNGFALC